MLNCKNLTIVKEVSLLLRDSSVFYKDFEKYFTSGTKEEDDDEEITEITGGNDDPGNHYGTRHITPKFLESGQTSRTLSSSSQNDPKMTLSPTITVTAPSDKDHVS